jgi:hypothetical protein
VQNINTASAIINKKLLPIVKMLSRLKPGVIALEDLELKPMNVKMTSLHRDLS